MSIPKQIILALFGPGFDRAYPGTLPEELADWHLYLPDCGHSILCLLDGHTDTNPIFEDLCPAPVKTVLRGYRIVAIDDIPVPVTQSGFTYDEMFGLRILEPADGEF